MTQQRWHRAMSQNPDRDPYEVAHHKLQARLLADPDGPEAADVVRTLAEAAEMLDADDLRVLTDSDLAGLFARVDAARDQVEAELDRRRRRAKR